MSLTKLDFLNLDFKMVEQEVPVFDGSILINGKAVIGEQKRPEQFEWRPATMKHKVVQAIDD